MKMLISPAKSLDFETPLPTQEHSLPLFLDQAVRINKLLKKKSVKSLAKLMHISETLAALNWERNQAFSLPFTLENARQAIFAFDGDVYAGLDIHSLSSNKYSDLQDKLYILSGLYGLLKPLDLIQPYRLEMGTKMSVGVKKNLPSFWKESITKLLNDNINSGEFVLNLASKEYAAAVEIKKLNAPLISPQFKDFKNGQLKMISFFAKKARGMMVRYVLDHNCTSLEEVCRFNSGGYQFSQEHTLDAHQPVFIR